MRLTPLWILFAGGLLVGAVALSPAAPAEAERWPVGLAKRVPLTTSKVVGSPNPPLPYRPVRAFPKLKIPCPIGVIHEPGSDRLWVLHQEWPWGGKGRIVRIKDDDSITESESFLDIDGIAYGVAFHPDFARNRYFYVGCDGPYDGKPTKYVRVYRYTLDAKPPYKIVPGSQKLIIQWESNGHNGGDVAFGPDGMFYVTSGDGTSDSDTNLTGQDLTKLLAKLLRIDVDHPDPDKAYSVPKDNPFVGRAGTRPETYAYGFRNPWRLHIDKQTGDIWVGQNGQDLWEQLYLVQKGANYGWSVNEGSHPFYLNRKKGPEPISNPIAEHSHSEMRSLTGGVVYRGKKLPDLHGTYVYGDFSTGKLFGIRHKNGTPTWHKELASTTMQVTGFGLDSHGELLIADHGGAGLFRLEPIPHDPNPPKFPTRLSETGLFASVKDHKVLAGVIPYSVAAPFWSDGAEKDRYLALPGESQIDFGRSRGWNFQDGAVVVKTFTLAMEDGNPASKKRIETRITTRQGGQWAGYSYLWNDAQTDAELVAGEGRDIVYDIRDPKSPGGVRKQVWRYPSRTECMVCHSRAANSGLGLTELQMNKVHDYGGVRANQLRTLEHLGVFRVNQLEHIGEIRRQAAAFSNLVQAGVRRPLEEARQQLPALPAVNQFIDHVSRPFNEPVAKVRQEVFRPLDEYEARLKDKMVYSTRLVRRPEEYRSLVNPYDKSADLDARARSFLHANCAQCHVEAGGGNAMMELEFTTLPEKMRTINAKPLHHTFDIPDAKLIVPGNPDKSVLFLRVARRGQQQMPPLASSMVDKEAVELLREWISKMPAGYGRPKEQK